MVNIAAERRISTISGHLAVGLLAEDVTSPSTNFLPLNCSNDLSTGGCRRLDNRLHYGRQGSASQGFFMRQAATPLEQNCSSKLSASFRRLDNRLQYGRQASASQGHFMRQAGSSMQSDVSCMSSVNENESSATTTPPLISLLEGKEPQFAKPKAESHFADVGVNESNTPANYMSSASEYPGFARPVTQTSKIPAVSSQVNGIEWSPRINVDEFKGYYVMRIQLPGANIKDVRVEMDDKNIIITSESSTKSMKAGSCSNDSFITYHKRGISQGQYQVEWHLPACANKTSIFAEIIDGLLQVTIPKL